MYVSMPGGLLIVNMYDCEHVCLYLDGLEGRWRQICHRWYCITNLKVDMVTISDDIYIFFLDTYTNV